MSAPTARHRAVVDPAVIDAAQGGVISLPEETNHRFRRVLRLEDGVRVVVFDGEGRWAEGVLVGDGLTEVQVHEQANSDFGPVIVQAWTRPKKLDGAIRRATEMGAGGFRIAVCARSQSHPRGDQGEKVATRLGRVAQEAARQSGRLHAPDVVAPQPLADVLQWQVQQGTPAICLDTVDGPPLSAVLSRLNSPSSPTLVVGPEGGFDDDERRLLLKAGALGASLGPTILRTETAAVCAVAIWAANQGLA